MRPGAFSSRLAAAGLSWLALFALLVTVGGAFGFRFSPPEGGLYGVDLAAGLTFGAALLVWLLLPRTD